MPSIFTLLRWLFRILLLVFQHKKQMDKVRAVTNEATRANEALQAALVPYKKGDYDTALQLTESLKQNGKETSHYTFMRGALLFEKGQFAEAEQLLRKSITVEENKQLLALRCSTLGQLLMKTERYDQAMKCFETGLQHWPGKGGLHRDMAEALLRRGGDPQQALQLAKQAVAEESNPGSSEEGSRNINLAENLATLAWAVANAEGPRPEVDQLVARAVPMVGKEVVSSLAHVHYHAGLAYVPFEDFDETRKHMEAAAQLDPNGRWGRDAKAMLDALCQHQ